MRSNRRAERRPARPLGAMRDREVTTVTVFEALLRRFGFVQWGDKLPRHAAYSTYQKIERDPMVTRIRERLRRDGELRAVTRRPGGIDRMKPRGLCVPVGRDEWVLLELGTAPQNVAAVERRQGDGRRGRREVRSGRQ